MKIITWNVNGLRSVMAKDKTGAKYKTSTHMSVVETLVIEQNPDILCLQEVRCDELLNLKALNLASNGYDHIYVNSAKTKKGYSGTAVFSKEKPLSVRRDFADFDDRIILNDEGRMLTLEFNWYFVINVYVPNSKADLSRLDYRIGVWEDAIIRYIKFLQETTGKMIIFCGDLNVAADPIDVHNPISARGASGYTDAERRSLKRLQQECDLVDSFRSLHPDSNKYSWFSAQTKARDRNKGWRIDYILVSRSKDATIQAADILLDYYGSDHIPCVAEII